MKVHSIWKRNFSNLSPTHSGSSIIFVGLFTVNTISYCESELTINAQHKLQFFFVLCLSTLSNQLQVAEPFLKKKICWVFKRVSASYEISSPLQPATADNTEADSFTNRAAYFVLKYLPITYVS